jgi:hypothetical protein
VDEHTVLEIAPIRHARGALIWSFAGFTGQAARRNDEGQQQQ